MKRQRNLATREQIELLLFENFMASNLRKIFKFFFCLSYFSLYDKAEELPWIFALCGIHPCSIVK